MTPEERRLLLTVARVLRDNIDQIALGNAEIDAFRLDQAMNSFLAASQGPMAPSDAAPLQAARKQ